MNYLFESGCVQVILVCSACVSAPYYYVDKGESSVTLCAVQVSNVSFFCPPTQLVWEGSFDGSSLQAQENA